MTKKIKLGVIGCSRIAKNSTIPAIIKSPYAELEIVGSRSEKKAKDYAREFNCKKFGSYETVLNDEEVDAIYISTPVGLHEEWVIKSAKVGKHIICEKSSTDSYQSALTMIDECRKNKVRLMEGFMFRFHPSHSKVLEIIKKGKLGNTFAFYSRYGFPPVPKDDIRFQKDLGGGALNDAGCYPICASRILFDKEPISISCELVMDKKKTSRYKSIVNVKIF